APYDVRDGVEHVARHGSGPRDRRRGGAARQDPDQGRRDPGATLQRVLPTARRTTRAVADRDPARPPHLVSPASVAPAAPPAETGPLRGARAAARARRVARYSFRSAICAPVA